MGRICFLNMSQNWLKVWIVISFSHHHIILIATNFVINQFYLFSKHELTFWNDMLDYIALMYNLPLYVLHRVVGLIWSISSIVHRLIVALSVVGLSWMEFALVLVETHHRFLLLQYAPIEHVRTDRHWIIVAVFLPTVDALWGGFASILWFHFMNFLLCCV